MICSAIFFCKHTDLFDRISLDSLTYRTRFHKTQIRCFQTCIIERERRTQKKVLFAWLFPQGRVKGGDEPPSRRPLRALGGDEGDWPALRKILPFE